jgi:hypothetical protein
MPVRLVFLLCPSSAMPLSSLLLRCSASLLIFFTVSLLLCYSALLAALQLIFCPGVKSLVAHNKHKPIKQRNQHKCNDEHHLVQFELA